MKKKVNFTTKRRLKHIHVEWYLPRDLDEKLSINGRPIKQAVSFSSCPTLRTVKRSNTGKPGESCISIAIQSASLLFAMQRYVTRTRSRAQRNVPWNCLSESSLPLPRNKKKKKKMASSNFDRMNFDC